MPEIVKSIEINLKSAFQASNLESEFRQKCRIIDIKTGNILSEKGWLDLFTGVWMELFCWWNSAFEGELANIPASDTFMFFIFAVMEICVCPLLNREVEKNVCWPNFCWTPTTNFSTTPKKIVKLDRTEKIFLVSQARALWANPEREREPERVRESQREA